MDGSSRFLPTCSAEEAQQLADKITLLAGQLNAGNHRFLKLIGEYDERKAWVADGTIRSCAHWLNWKCGVSLTAAREKLRVARCLSALPKIDAAFATGEISYSKVRAMVRVATPENEDYLLMIAQYGTATQMEKLVGKYRSIQCANEDSQEKEQKEQRNVAYHQDDDGSWVIRARLPAETGALVVKAIEAVARPIQLEKQAEIVEAHRQRESGKNDSAESSSEEEETLAVKTQLDYIKTYAHAKADALITVAEHFLATSDQNNQFQGLKGSERCQIMLHVDIDTLRTHNTGKRKGTAQCNLDDKHWISPKTAKRLACDATLVTVLEDDQNNVLNIGRRSRTVPAAIKRALSLRDKTCRVPGCCQSRDLDAHHIQHWADGGETSLSNLLLMCRHHHRQLHEGVFSIRVEQANASHAEPHLIFTTPQGQTIQASFFPQFPEHVAEDAEVELAQAAPAVDMGSCITRWCGDHCDYDMAITALAGRSLPASLRV